MKDDSRFIPSLLDRLTDNEPGNKHDSSRHYGIHLSQYRKAVLRDVLFLLNTNCLHSENLFIVLPDEVRNSTLNYGIPAFAGANVASINWLQVEKDIHNAITFFEPRLVEADLKVEVFIKGSDYANYNELLIEVKGMMKLNPYPKEFWLKTTIDVEIGSFILADSMDKVIHE